MRYVVDLRHPLQAPCGAIGLKVKQEFAAKEKARLTKKPATKAVAKAQTKPAKKAKAVSVA